jgi:MFS family permease
MIEQLSCVKCYFQSAGPLAQCPQCGSRMITARQIRTLGWLLVATGVFLVVFMGALIILLSDIMARSNDPTATTRLAGTPLQGALILGILALVMAFGVTALIAGVYQIRYGRRNRKLIAVALLLAFVFIAIGTIFQAFG